MWRYTSMFIRIEEKHFSVKQLIDLFQSIAENEQDLQLKSHMFDDKHIENVLLGLQIHKIFVEEDECGRYIEIRGGDELYSLIAFVLNENIKCRNFTVLSEYNGKSFNELPERVQRNIKSTIFTLHKIDIDCIHTKNYDEVMSIVKERLS